MQEISEKFANDSRKHEYMERMSLIEESFPKKVRMANLCVLASHKVNGVAALHSELVKTKLFPEFNDYFPGKFTNKTNGVTPRRWIHCANRELSDLYAHQLDGYEWLTDLYRLRDLDHLVNDPEFLEKWRTIKLNNKVKLAAWVKKETPPGGAGSFRIQTLQILLFPIFSHQPHKGHVGICFIMRNNCIFPAFFFALFIDFTGCFAIVNRCICFHFYNFVF